MRTASDKGSGAFKTFLSLLFLAAVGFSAFKIIPVYINNYELQGFLNDLVVQVTVQNPPATPEGVRNQVLAKADELELPVRRDDIQVSIGRTVRINVKYSVDVNLEVYTLTLHFSPSAENSSVT